MQIFTNRGKQLNRRSKWQGNINASRKVDDFNIGGAVHYSGKSFDNASNSRKLTAWKTLALRES